MVLILSRLEIVINAIIKKTNNWAVPININWAHAWPRYLSYFSKWISTTLWVFDEIMREFENAVTPHWPINKVFTCNWGCVSGFNSRFRTRTYKITEGYKSRMVHGSDLNLRMVKSIVNFKMTSFVELQSSRCQFSIFVRIATFHCQLQNWIQ